MLSTKDSDLLTDFLFFGVLLNALVQLFFSFLFAGEECLRIKELMVPNVVQNGSEEDVVLDCDYAFENSDSTGLVVKWFLNDGESPVYQWIPPKPPQDFGKLKVSFIFFCLLKRYNHYKHVKQVT